MAGRVVYQAAKQEPRSALPRAGFMHFAISGIASMRAFASALVCIAPLSTLVTEENATLQRAFRITTQDHLLSWAGLLNFDPGRSHRRSGNGDGSGEA
jgi:hypothetical protein